jgi:hypothetical protein
MPVEFQYSFGPEIDIAPKKFTPYPDNYAWAEWVSQHLHVLSSEGSDDFIECPWASEHTGGINKPKDAKVFYGDGSFPGFNCFHASCHGRTFNDIINKIGKHTLNLPPDPVHVTTGTSTPGSGSDSTASNSTSAGMNLNDLADDMMAGDIRNDIIVYGYMIDDGALCLASTQCENIRIIAPSAITKHNLLSLRANYADWETAFGIPNNKGQYHLRMEDVADYFYTEAQKLGPFKEQKVAKLGIFEEFIDGKKQYVLNTGHNIVLNNEKYNYRTFTMKFKGQCDNIYMPVSRDIKIHDTPLSEEDGTKLVEILKKCPFSKPYDYMIMAGFIAAAMIPGGLSQNPSIKMSGEAGSGKTELERLFIHKLLAIAGAIFCEGGSTAAGIEQFCQGNHSVVMDEVEQDSFKNKAMMDAILDAINSTTTSSVGSVIKGTQNGTPIVRFGKRSYYLSSVTNVIEKGSHLRRIVMVDLDKSKCLPLDEWQDFEKYVETVLTPEFASKMMRRMYNSCSLINSEIYAMKKKLAKDADLKHIPPSMISLYSVIYVCYSALLHKDNLAEQVYKEIKFNLLDDCPTERESSDKKDWKNCLDTLMTLPLRASNNKVYQVQECLRCINGQLPGMEIENITFLQLLRNHGLTISKDCLCVSNCHSVLKGLFSKVGIFSHKTYLKGIPGVQEKGNVRFNSLMQKALAIPMSMLNLEPDPAQPKVETPNIDLNDILGDA